MALFSVLEVRYKRKFGYFMSVITGLLLKLRIISCVISKDLTNFLCLITAQFLEGEGSCLLFSIFSKKKLKS